MSRSNPLPRRTNWRPILEVLEDRCQLSVTVSNGVLIIVGMESPDTVIVVLAPTADAWQVSFNGDVTNHLLAGIDSLRFDGNGGNDYFEHGITGHWSGQKLPTMALGGLGDDTLMIIEKYGGGPAHVLSGDDGADFLKGGWANDSLYGGNGRDTLVGDTGDDDLFGGDGKDKLYGGIGTFARGYDILKGGRGNDYLDGGQGETLSDHLFGGPGADRFARDVILFGTNHDKAKDFKTSQRDRYVDPAPLLLAMLADNEDDPWA